MDRKTILIIDYVGFWGCLLSANVASGFDNKIGLYSWTVGSLIYGTKCAIDMWKMRYE